MVDIIDIAERLCTPEQAKRLKELGVRQLTQYAWQHYEGKWILLIDDSDMIEDGAFTIPPVVDWKDDEGCYAAFDMTDLSRMMRSIGHYLSGPSAQQYDPPEDQTYWADDIASITDFGAETYKAYGATEAQARAGLIIYLIDNGVPAPHWEYYYENKAEALVKLTKRKHYGNNETE